MSQNRGCPYQMQGLSLHGHSLGPQGSLGGVRWGSLGFTGGSLGESRWGLLGFARVAPTKKTEGAGVGRDRPREAKTGLPSKSMTGDWRAAIGGEGGLGRRLLK